MDILGKWNLADQLIYKVENLIKTYATSHKDEIDVETMIMAETDYLQKENDKLKQLRHPGRLILQEGGYLCPHCKETIAAVLIDKYMIKYCPECGKRIILSIPSSVFKGNNLVSQPLEEPLNQ